jgi:hypothetical protein
MKVRFVPIMLALALAGLTSPTVAQEERGQLWDVQTIKVRPDHMDEFMEAVGTIKAAAEAANLAPEWGWHVWTEDFDVHLASMASDMASFDDPEAWMRQFEGTPGQEMVAGAMTKLMTEIAAQPGNRELYEHMEAWSYAPEAPVYEQPAGAYRHDFWIKPGMAEAFEKVIKDIMAFQMENGAFYSVEGHRVHFGDAGKATFLVVHGGWADFYGKNSFEAQVEAAGKAAAWEEIMTALRDCITAYESSQMEYVPDLSYLGPGM